MKYIESYIIKKNMTSRTGKGIIEFDKRDEFDPNKITVNIRIKNNKNNPNSEKTLLWIVLYDHELMEIILTKIMDNSNIIKSNYKSLGSDIESYVKYFNLDPEESEFFHMISDAIFEKLWESMVKDYENGKNVDLYKSLFKGLKKKFDDKNFDTPLHKEYLNETIYVNRLVKNGNSDNDYSSDDYILLKKKIYPDDQFFKYINLDSKTDKIYTFKDFYSDKDEHGVEYVKNCYGLFVFTIETKLTYQKTTNSIYTFNKIKEIHFKEKKNKSKSNNYIMKKYGKLEIDDDVKHFDNITITSTNDEYSDDNISDGEKEETQKEPQPQKELKEPQEEIQEEDFIHQHIINELLTS